MTDNEIVATPVEATESLQGTTEALSEATENVSRETSAKTEPVADEKISGKVALILKREQQFQARARAEKGKLAEERAQLAAQRAEVEALQAKYARIKEDPIEGLKESGINYETLTRNIINANTPESKIDALERKLAAFEQQREREQQEHQQKSAISNIENGKKSYQEHIVQNEAKYPTLALYDEGEVREAAWNVAMQYYKKTQIAPDPEEVAEYLENQALERHKMMEERKAKRTTVETAKAPEKAAKGSPKTLSNAKKQERAAPPMPDNYHKLSKEEQREIDAEFLKNNLWKD